jgi:hypothetical protein
VRTAWEKRDHGTAHDWPTSTEYRYDCTKCGAGFMGPRGFVVCYRCTSYKTPAQKPDMSSYSAFVQHYADQMNTTPESR